MSEVSNIIKCRVFLALTIYKHLNLNNLVKYDQGFCAYELTHPAVHGSCSPSVTEVNLHSNRLGHKEKTRTGMQRKWILRTSPPKQGPIKINKQTNKDI